VASESEVHGIRSGLAQLLSEVIIGIHPHVARLAEGEKESFRAKFLDGLEDHTAALVNPLLHAVTNQSTLPEEIRGLVAELGEPTEQFTGIISQFFVFGIMFTLAQAMLAPFVQQLNNDVWTSHPDRPLSPPDAATAVVRGIPFGSAEGATIDPLYMAEAAKSGLDSAVFSTMVGVTGMAPPLQLLFEMIRRQIIPEGALNEGGVSLIAGIQQSDIKDEWIDSVKNLRYVQPTPIDMVRAAVQAQDDSVIGNGPQYDTAKQWAAILGLEPAGYLNNNPSWFDLLYNTSGRPPGPVEMSHAANRGFIPWTGLGSGAVTFEQAIRESDIKDKYIPVLQQLAVYYPASGEIRQLLLHGGIDEATALALWKDDGVPDTIAQAFLHLAQIEQVTQDKALAKADILTLVQEQAIDDAEALILLEQIGYTGTNANYLLSMTHFRYELDALRSVVRRVASLYTGRKISAAQATEALQGFGMPAAQITSLLATFDNQRAAEALIPSAAQVAGALFYQIIDQPTAQSLLESLGYSPWSAWLVLSDRMHAPLPNEPAQPAGGGFGN
jgi:hypothetical protein